jgi:hypothetical protein
MIENRESDPDGQQRLAITTDFENQPTTCVGAACNPLPEPVVAARVLTPPWHVFPYECKNIPDPAGNEILGGGLYPEGVTPPLADDFEWTFNVSNGRFTGIVDGLTEASCSNDEPCVPVPNDQPAPATVDFQWPNQNTGPCVSGVCEVTDATMTQDAIKNLTGMAFSKPGFFSYQLINTPVDGSEDNPEPVLLFGGSAYSFPVQGTGQLHEFQLTADAVESGAVLSCRRTPRLFLGRTRLRQPSPR